MDSFLFKSKGFDPSDHPLYYSASNAKTSSITSIPQNATHNKPPYSFTKNVTEVAWSSHMIVSLFEGKKVLGWVQLSAPHAPARDPGPAIQLLRCLSVLNSHLHDLVKRNLETPAGKAQLNAPLRQTVEPGSPPGQTQHHSCHTPRHGVGPTIDRDSHGHAANSSSSQLPPPEVVVVDFFVFFVVSSYHISFTDVHLPRQQDTVAKHQPLLAENGDSLLRLRIV